MTKCNYVYIEDSSFLLIHGEDCVDYLQGLITNDINKCKNNEPIYSCLLTPQGKFLCDFFIINYNEKFLIEINKFFFDSFIENLNKYKLNSNIKILTENNFSSLVILNSDNKKNINNIDHIEFIDPRCYKLGKKIFLKKELKDDFVEKNQMKVVDFDIYRELMIKNLVPYAPEDLTTNKSLLLENNFERNNAIDWNKGCYIGQEITARMKYRALLKKRIYSLNLKKGSPNIQQTIKEEKNEYGKIINVKNKSVLAMLKIDLATKKINSKQLIKTDDGIVLDFIT